MKLTYLFNSQQFNSLRSTYVFVKRGACAERSTVCFPQILKNGETLFLIIRDTVILYTQLYFDSLDKSWKG